MLSTNTKDCNMKTGSAEIIALPENLRYCGDYSSIVKLEDLRFKAIVNAICATFNVKHAALELGISEKSVIDFCGEHGITHKIRKQMRDHFSTIEVRKIKYKYDYVQK